jgi:modification methylase
MTDKKKYKRNGTKTSSFGSPGRIGHDSSIFYSSRLYGDKRPSNEIEFIQNEISSETIDRLYCKSSEVMQEIFDNSLHLMVTSPPYNVGKEYDQDMSLGEYREFLKKVFKETYRVLVPGGRACINIANLGRKPLVSGTKIE